ncbi:MAG: hypothetical protein ABIG42_03175 [bacterium]
MPVIIPYVPHSSRMKSKGRIVGTWRKCQFCSAINRPNQKKCRKCGLTYPYETKNKETEIIPEFHISLDDPRTEKAKKFETTLIVILILFTALLFGIPYLFRDYPGNELLKSISTALPGFTSAFFAAFIAASSRNRTEYKCQSCGQIMVIRVSSSRNMFPSGVKCWNCGAIHNVTWKNGASKMVSGTNFF